MPKVQLFVIVVSPRFSLWKPSIPIYNSSLFPELFNAP
jgi:hypothetical protein